MTNNAPDLLWTTPGGAFFVMSMSRRYVSVIAVQLWLSGRSAASADGRLDVSAAGMEFSMLMKSAKSQILNELS